MHLPLLDPNFVLWCTLIADVFCTLASGTAAYAAVRLLLHKLAEIRAGLEGKK